LLFGAPAFGLVLMLGCGLPILELEWTGEAPRLKCEEEANPFLTSMTAGTSLRKQAEVTGPYAAQKSR
jgi:hypothetical protein